MCGDAHYACKDAGRKEYEAKPQDRRHYFADRSATVDCREHCAGRYLFDGCFDQVDDVVAAGAGGAADSDGELFAKIGHSLVTVH